MHIQIIISKECVNRTEALAFWLAVQQALEPIDGVVINAHTTEEIGREVKNEAHS